MYIKKNNNKKNQLDYFNSQTGSFTIYASKLMLRLVLLFKRLWLLKMRARFYTPSEEDRRSHKQEDSPFSPPIKPFSLIYSWKSCLHKNSAIKSSWLSWVWINPCFFSVTYLYLYFFFLNHSILFYDQRMDICSINSCN